MRFFPLFLIFFVSSFNFFYINLCKDIFLSKDIKKTKDFLRKENLEKTIIQKKKYSYHQNFNVIQSLLLVKKFVVNNDFSSAEKEIISLLKKNRKKRLESLIYLQLARIQLQKKNITESLRFLKKIKEDCWIKFSEHFQKNISSFQNGDMKNDSFYEAILLKYENKK